MKGSDIKYQRHEVANICPACGARCETTFFRVDCAGLFSTADDDGKITVRKCRNYSKAFADRTSGVEIGDRIEFLVGTDKADWSSWAAFKADQNLKYPGTHCGTLWFSAGKLLDGLLQEMIVTKKETFQGKSWIQINVYKTLWLPASAAKKYSQ